MTTAAILTAKQARFAQEYLVDANGAAAAVRAGYSERTAKAIACELLTKPDLQAAIAEGQAALAREVHMTCQGVIKGLLEAVELAREQREPMGMVRGLSELAHLLGFYPPRQSRVAGTTAEQAELGRLDRYSDAELLKMIAVGHGV